MVMKKNVSCHEKSMLMKKHPFSMFEPNGPRNHILNLKEYGLETEENSAGVKHHNTPCRHAMRILEQIETRTHPAISECLAENPLATAFGPRTIMSGKA